MAAGWMLVIFVLITVIHRGSTLTSRGAGVTAHFSQHEVVWPRIKHVQRHVEGHSPQLEVTLKVKDQEIVLDLKLNTDLLSKGYFVKHEVNGTHKIHKPKNLQEAELCQYHGKVRGVPGSWAAISTCHRLSGVIYNGEELLLLEPDDSTSGDRHLLFKHQHYVSTSNNSTQCGVKDSYFTDNVIEKHKRQRRDVIVTSQHSAHNPRYLEMMLVVDYGTFIKLGADQNKITRHCKNLINILNAVVSQLNILVALVGVEIWSSGDKINNPNTLNLNAFLKYREEHILPNHPHDNAQLLVATQAEDGVIGKALVSAICLKSSSGAVIVEHSEVEAMLALTMAHELGHNLGMGHDSQNECQCETKDKLCVMAAQLNSPQQTLWSSCSRKDLQKTLESGLDSCLHNLPQKLFSSPDCGNGFLEAGEECDCGPVKLCSTRCCDPLTCRLTVNSTCGTGPCCDKSTCQLKQAGSTCRPVTDECDLPEFCNGKSEICPRDFTKQDGDSCHQDKGFCYGGKCGSPLIHCSRLWDPSSRPASKLCYEYNKQRLKKGECVYDPITKQTSLCGSPDDMLCGRAYCTRNENTPTKILFETITVSVGQSLKCHAARVHISPRDLGLTPDGAPCGPGKMCVREKCVPVQSVQQVKQCSELQCYGHGVCNNLGKCHCDIGFAPPDCLGTGYGGSEDSGPATNPDKNRVLIGFLIFLGAIMLMTLVLVFLVIYSRRLALSPDHPRTKNGYLPSMPRLKTRATEKKDSRTISDRKSRVFSIFRPTTPATSPPVLPVIRPSRAPPSVPTTTKSTIISTKKSPPRLPAVVTRPAPSIAVKQSTLRSPDSTVIKTETNIVISASSQKPADVKGTSSIKTNFEEVKGTSSNRNNFFNVKSTTSNLPDVKFTKSVNSKAKQEFLKFSPDTQTQSNKTNFNSRVKTKNVSKLAKQFESK